MRRTRSNPWVSKRSRNCWPKQRPPRVRESTSFTKRLTTSTGRIKTLSGWAKTLKGSERSVRVARHVRSAAADEEIEICPLVRLLNMFDVKPQPATLRKWWRRPCCPTNGESSVIDVQPKQPIGHIERDCVARLHQRERAAGCGFWTGMQNYGPIGRAAHASVGNTDHIADTLAEDLWRQQHVADFRHAGVATRAAILQDHDTVLVDIQRLVVNPGVKSLNGFEHHRSSAMLQQARTRG